eukprot:7344359-Pyramimonas_sp.AAC.1
MLLQRAPQRLFLEDNQAACTAFKTWRSQKLVHSPRAHRIHALPFQRSSARVFLDLQCERAQSEAAGIGTDRFTGPLAGVKVLNAVNLVSP